MSIAAGILLFVATVAAMEGVAYAAHRWIMHGPGWFLHASHHRPRHGPFEANDLYAVIFAIPSFVLLLGGVRLLINCTLEIRAPPTRPQVASCH